jgi:chromosomal replication initiator protein
MTEHVDTPPTSSAVKAAVADFYDVPVEQLQRSGGRAANVAWARHMAIYLERLVVPGRRESLPAIGRDFGMDHTSVLYAVRKMQRRVLQDPHVRDELDHLLVVLGVPGELGRLLRRLGWTTVSMAR